ncbi:hypothetical protein COCON_G00064860 [Conger conger]|uniref:Uncharacterized protein n=1 Tax=Conger conger TaxID=82655 RepID=A0A9Q1DS22_CONCO|nr:hypothetical protein COCON_G00064860 [Conger conger]
MATEEIGQALQSQPSLSPKPQVPPKPEPRGTQTRPRRATDVIRSEVPGKEREQRHKSLPSFPTDQSSCLSVATDDSPFPQPDELLSFSEKVMPLPVPKPRLQETPLPQDSKSQAADKEIVSSTTTLQSPDSGDSGEAASTEHEGRLFDGCNDSEGDSPSSEIQLVCTPSSPHSSSDPKAGEKPHRIEPYPEAPLNSQPGVFLHFEGDRKEEPDIPEGMYMELGTSPSEVDVHCTTVVLCSSNLGSPVFPDGGVREAEHPPFSKVHNPLPRPCQTPATTKDAKHKHGQGNEEDL